MMSKGLENLTSEMFELHESRARYKASFYGVGLGAVLYLFGLASGSDTTEFVGLALAGFAGLRGYFAYRKVEKLETEINERLKELKEKGYIKEND